MDTLLLPGTPVTARPIDDVEPYMTINGRKVGLLIGMTLPISLAPHC